jgi:thiamine kinase-like enzyme
MVLCRVDPSPLNFIRRPDNWASVDWENSGWGDPAFDIAELITHPAYREVPAHRWDWVVRAYCDLTGRTGIAGRVAVYRRVLLVWWAARLARYLYEVPRGGDQRLVERPDGWQADMQAKYAHYVQIAQAESRQAA